MSMSSILAPSSRDHVDSKLIRFLILLSESKLDSAYKNLHDFSNKTYVHHLQKLIKKLCNEQIMKTEALMYQLRIRQLQSKIQVLINKSSSELKQLIGSNQQSQILAILYHIERQSLEQAKELARMCKRDAVRKTIEELIEYRALKKQISANKLLQQEQLIEEGRSFVKIIQDYIRLKQSISKQLVGRIQNCLNDRPIEILPQHLFLADCRQQFEQLTKKFRQMKDQLHNSKHCQKQQINEFVKQHALDWKHREQQGMMQSFISLFKRQLHSPQNIYHTQNPRAKAVVKQNLNQSNMYDHNRRHKTYKSKPSLSQSQHMKSSRIYPEDIQKRLNQIQQALTDTSSKIGFNSLTVSQKLDAILGEARQLSKRQKIKLKDTLALLRKQDEEPPVLIQRPSNEVVQEQHKGVKQLQDRIDMLEKQVEILKQENKGLRERNNKMILRLKEQQALNNSSFIESPQPNIEKEKENLHIEIQRMKSDITEKANRIQILQQERQKYKKDLKNQKENYAKLQKKYSKLKEECDQQIHSIQVLNKLYEERFTLQPSDKQKLNESMVGRITEENTKLQRENMALAEENQRLQELNKPTHTQEIAVGQSILMESLQSQPNESFIANGSFLQSMRKQQSIIMQVDPKIYQEKISGLQHHLETLTLQLNQKDEIIWKINKKCEQLTLHLESLQKEKQELAHRLDIIDIRNITHNPQNVNNVHLFPPGFIFGEHDYLQRQFLLQNLISYVGPIRSTRLLYRADPFNKTNFHNYIDKNQHVVLICKTIYGKMIAGYSSQAFDPKGIQKGRGMILSLWSRKAFYVKDKKAISYDDYYIIYGNSELRVRSLQFKLFSNFGIANAYYENNGARVDIILGQGSEREVDLLEYEVYALDLWQ